MRAAILCSLLALAACGGPDNGTAILLTIDAGDDITSDALATIDQVAFHVTGVDTYDRTLVLTRHLERAEKILYKTQNVSGIVDIEVLALAGEAQIAVGDAQLTLEAGKTVEATVTLSTGGVVDTDMGTDDAGVLGVTPAMPTIGTLRPIAFSAAEAVTWAVMEAGGGTIDASGGYFSPATPGTYHVIATSTADTSKVQTVTVTVVPLKLNLVAGTLGGPGSADGVGAAARFDGPNAMKYYTGGGQYLLLADRNNHLIRRFDTVNNAVTTIAGSAEVQGLVDDTGTAAAFYRPNGVVVDFNNVAYVSDSGNLKIRKVILATGVTTTFSTPAFLPSSMEGFCSDGNNLYSVDGTGNKIWMIAITTGVASVMAGSGSPMTVDNMNGAAASFSNPHSLFCDTANGRLFVGESTTIRAVSTTSPYAVQTLSSLDSSYGSTGGLAFDPTPSKLFVGNQNCVRSLIVSTMNITSSPATVAGDCAMQGSTDGASAKFSDVTGMEFDSAGNLFVADYGIPALRKLNGGVVTTVAGKAGGLGDIDDTGPLASFNAPLAVATDGTFAYIGESDGGGAVRKVELATGKVTTLVMGAPAVKVPIGLVLYMNKLWAVDAGNHTLVSFDTTNGAMTVMAGMTGVTGTANNAAGTNATFNMPTGLASDGAGMLYIADNGNNLVRSYNVATTEVKTVAGTGMGGADNGPAISATFNQPGDVSFANNALYIADSINNSIRKIDLATMMVSTYAGSVAAGQTDGPGATASFSKPWRAGTDGRSLYVTAKDTSTVRRIDLATGIVSTFVGKLHHAGTQATALPASVNGPGGVAPLPNGDLLLLDFNEGALLSVTSP